MLRFSVHIIITCVAYIDKAAVLKTLVKRTFSTGCSEYLTDQ